MDEKGRSTMNRAQRRKFKNDQKVKNFPKQTKTTKAEQPDFSNVPLATMCQSIQLLINELYNRGYPLYDFDNKTKFVQGIQIIQGKVYFLAAEEVKDHEKA